MVSFTEMEQNVSSLTQNVSSVTSRMCKIETNAASASGIVARQFRGSHLVRLMVRQPQGPMTQGHLKRAGTQDSDSIHSQIQMTKMLAVPFFYGFHANDAMPACPLGSKRYLQQPTCLQPICPSGFTAKQAPHLLDLYSAREPNVKNLWQHTETMVSHIQLIALHEDREIRRRLEPLWEVLAPKLQEIFHSSVA